MNHLKIDQIDLGDSFSEGEDDHRAAVEMQTVANSVQQAPAEDVSDAIKSKVDNYNFEAAISEISQVINQTSEMYQKLKRIKFNYLVLTCNLHSRIDFPSIMMAACQKEISKSVPKAKDVEKLQFWIEEITMSLF